MMCAGARSLIWASLVLLGSSAGTARACTPFGAPAGLTSPIPTGLLLESERTELVFHGGSDSLSYFSRVTLHNPGAAGRVELEMRFIHARGRGEGSAPPVCRILVNGRSAEITVDAMMDTMTSGYPDCRFRLPVEIPSGSDATVEVRAMLSLQPDDCGNPPYQLQWAAADDRAFDVTDADREALFAFDPIRTPVDVDARPDGGVFMDGVIAWRWKGPTPEEAFFISFQSSEGDDHFDWFPTAYELSSYACDRDYLELWKDCDIEEIEYIAEPGAPDTLTAAIRDWIESGRFQANDVIDSIAKRHPGLSPEDLNPVERRNLETARSILQALDATRRPSEILKALDEADLY